MEGLHRLSKCWAPVEGYADFLIAGHLWKFCSTFRAHKYGYASKYIFIGPGIDTTIEMFVPTFLPYIHTYASGSHESTWPAPLKHRFTIIAVARFPRGYQSLKPGKCRVVQGAQKEIPSFKTIFRDTWYRLIQGGDSKGISPQSHSLKINKILSRDLICATTKNEKVRRSRDRARYSPIIQFTFTKK